ncbi:carbohydrate ABC transporter substrate-binding protein, CUT1 family [Micromonospora pattaloongensis]|uniref:Carbohydrate ABC transporter substrate-binding protein, CUT1 family n=1 Tax=Micromonospora pattaloongensis TaxID=405436 RepID=A0A1H3G203_9ACTN|nr:carbohydrate ABC transporter substrate-binding protein, CUT1 family [Micromonospora pattaloongensis]
MPPTAVSPTRRRLLLAPALAAALVLVGAAAACGGGDDAGAGDKRVQLSVFWWGGEKRAELTEQALRLYSSRHPEVTFKVTWQGNTGYYDKLATQAAGGNAPDLFQIDDNYLSEYTDRKVILDLTPYVADNRIDLSKFPSSLAQYGQVGGRTMAVAGAANTPAMVYNRTLLKNLGLPEPRIGMTYDELIAWGSRVTDRSRGRVAGTMDPSADYKALWLWLRSQDKDLYRGRQIGFTEDDLTRWFELWRRAHAAGATPDAATLRVANNGDVSRQLVATRKAATSFMWSNQLTELQKYTTDELGVVSYPGDPQAQWARASMYWAAFRGTRHPDVVVDVINFLVNDPEAGRILGTERGLSSNTEIRQLVQAGLTDERMKATAAFETAMVERFGPAPVPPPRGHPRVRALLITAAENVQAGRATPRQAAAEFIAQANAALAG